MLGGEGRGGPGNGKAPELALSEADCKSTNDATATPILTDFPPNSYPRQEILPARQGGWDLVRWDGYGTTMRAWRRYRWELSDLLSEIGGRLTETAADVVYRQGMR